MTKFIFDDVARTRKNPRVQAAAVLMQHSWRQREENSTPRNRYS